MGVAFPRVVLAVDMVNYVGQSWPLLWPFNIVAAQPLYGRFLFTSYDIAVTS